MQNQKYWKLSRWNSTHRGNRFILICNNNINYNNNFPVWSIPFPTNCIFGSIVNGNEIGFSCFSHTHTHKQKTEKRHQQICFGVGVCVCMMCEQRVITMTAVYLYPRFNSKNGWEKSDLQWMNEYINANMTRNRSALQYSSSPLHHQIHNVFAFNPLPNDTNGMYGISKQTTSESET